MPNSERISVTFPLDPALSYGDSVKIRGKVQNFEPSPEKKIAYMTKPEFTVVSQGSSTNLIYKLRENIISFLIPAWIAWTHP